MIYLNIRSKWRRGAVTLLFASANILVAQPGQFPNDRPPQPGALNLIPVPLPANLADFVADKKAAIVLGKALFWDQQAGSDGLACASCHFHAGADSRIKNQIDPGLRNTNPALQNTSTWGSRPKSWKSAAPRCPPPSASTA